MKILAAAACAIALAGCGKLPTQNWAESIERATTAWKANDFKRVLQMCQRAFDQAIEAGAPARAIQAHECEAEAAWKLGKPELSFKNLEFLVTRYEKALAPEFGAIRLRNNRGVALIAQGKREEGLAAIEAAMDAYEGTPHHSANYFRVRMILVNNLLRLVVTEPESALGVRLSSQVLDEIERRIERDTRLKAETPAGYAEALKLIAKIVSARGDPAAGKALAERARELKAEEDEMVAATRLESPLCHKLTIRLLAFTACYREVPPYLEPIT